MYMLYVKYGSIQYWHEIHRHWNDEHFVNILPSVCQTKICFISVEFDSHVALDFGFRFIVLLKMIVSKLN